jgi:phosphoserine aminotransferase
LDAAPNLELIIRGGVGTDRLNAYCTDVWLSDPPAKDYPILNLSNVIFDGADNGYNFLTDGASIKVNQVAAYLHMRSHETTNGIQWKDWPETGAVRIICDMSSDILSRPVPVEKFGVIYAGAQKNLDPSGVTLVIIRDDMVKRCPDSLTTYLNYKIHAEKNSLYNTPPVFSIYAMKLVLEGMKKNGGLEEMVLQNRKKEGI